MEAPKFPSIFRNVRKEPRKFSYRPKHYNPRKDELDERKRKIEAEVEREQGKANSNFRRAEFKPSWGGQKYRQGASAANLRLVVILMILLFITYMVVQWLGKLD